jgi:GNAT superfamily N-acetyltransferase
MSILEFQISDRPTTEETETVFRHLIGFNEAQTGPASARELAVFSRRGTEIVAGLLGFTHWNWFHIRYLWVAESLRHQGLGRRLVLAAEQEARRRGCEHAHLDTFSFQAVPFYECLGYSIFGRLEDYPAGHSRIFLQKRNLSE